MTTNENMGVGSLKAEIFDGIEDAKMRQVMMNHVAMIAVILEGTECKFDMDSISRLEQQLNSAFKSRVLKWGRGAEKYEMKRIRMSSGLQTSNKENIEMFQQIFSAYSVFYAYCYANILGGKFVIKEGHPHVDTGIVGVPLANPIDKPIKFLRNGAEDSLVGFINITKRRASFWPLFENATEHIKAERLAAGTPLPEDFTTQVWCDPTTGELERIVFVDGHGEPICQAVIATADYGDPVPSGAIRVSTKTGKIVGGAV